MSFSRTILGRAVEAVISKIKCCLYSMRFLLCVAAALVLIPFSANASTVVRTGDVVSLAADQSVEGDFYGLGGTTAVSGEVSEDLFLIGGTVTMNGDIGADVAAVGGTIDIHGAVGDDVRVIGGTVVVAGTVEGNLVVVASELKVLSTAVIGGDVMFFGGNADVSGAVGKDVLGTSEYLRIDGSVGGNVDIKAGSVVLGDRAEITGRLSYNSPQDLIRAQNAIVTGEIVRSEEKVAPDNALRSLAVAFLATLFAALVLFLLGKPFVHTIVSRSHDRAWRSVFIGFGFIFLVPIAAVILLVSTLGTLVGFLLLFAYLALLCLAFILVGPVIGSYVMRFTKQSPTVTVLTIVLGTALAYVVMIVPVLGQLLLLLTVTLTLGVVAEYFVRIMRS